MRGRRRAALVTVAMVVVVSLIGGACSGPNRSESRGTRSDQPVELRWRPADDVVICDGTERPAGTVEQAEAGETIEFSTALPIDVPTGKAGDDGNYPLRWTCQPEEAQLRWTLTATGADSGRTVGLIIAGAPAPLGTLGDLTVSVYDGTVVCDGIRRDAGVVSGLEVGERVDFESEQAGEGQSKRADNGGSAVFAWSCRPGDVGQSWEATAIAEESDRWVSFRLEGLAPAEDLAIEVLSPLDEVVCDGQVQTLASLANLFPEETVTFTVTPGADDLRDGEALADGTLDLRWQCDRSDVGQVWELTALAAETAETATIRFTGVAGQPPGEATVELLEDPFRCDGERRPVARLGELAEGEFVDFTSPQSGPLRDGRSRNGELVVNWQCSAVELGQADNKVWEVTATGRQSGRAVTFVVTGVIVGADPSDGT